MRNFNFSLYRLNIVDNEDIFSFDKQTIRGDELILEVLSKATTVDYDDTQSTSSSLYQWGIRELQDFSSVITGRTFVTCTLARSLLERTGTVVTEDGLTEGRSASYPPLAETIFIVFDMSRHLVAVEKNSLWQSGGYWKTAFNRITGKAADANNLSSSLSLEEVPGHSTVFALLNSFDRVTRIRLTVRVPNPELSTYTKQLAEELNIPFAFDQKMMDKYNKYKDNKDSLTRIIYESYDQVDRSLKNDERVGMAALVVTGSWLEGLYLSTKTFLATPKTDDNNSLYKTIGGQKQSLVIVIKLLEEYKDDAFIAGIIADLKLITSEYKDISNNSMMNEKQLVSIHAKVEKLRKKIIEGI